MLVPIHIRGVIKCHKIGPLRTIEIYCLVVLEARSLQAGCQQNHAPSGSYESPSHLPQLLVLGGRSVRFLGLSLHRSSSKSARGLPPCLSLSLHTKVFLQGHQSSRKRVVR